MSFNQTIYINFLIRLTYELHISLFLYLFIDKLLMIKKIV